MQPTFCRTNLIDDTPSPQDDFGGAHARLADAIENIVLNRDGGFAMAIEGGWGSGKSTVIQLLGKKLPNKVFVFDAWAHQGDPLRRSFIEKLYEFLRERPGPKLDQKKWDFKLKELSRRIKVQETTPVPRPAPFGLFVVFSFLLFQIGSQFLVQGFKEPSAPPAFGWLGIVFTSILFITLIVALLSHFWSSSEKTGAFSSRRWALLIDPKITSTRSESHETPDPTSVEFESIFCDLLTEALREDEDRLIIVFDNLDRVSISDASAIWSTMRAFLELGHHNNSSWYRRTWVIVPYDPSGVAQIWREPESSVRESYLDKSFLARLTVPPPVLSDWKSYLHRLLNEAFPDHHANQPGSFHRVYRILRSQFEAGSLQLTPRKIKTIVNDLAALHLQWQDSIPLEIMTFYIVAMKPEPGSIPGKLRRRDFPDDTHLAILGAKSQNVRDYSAMLYFNVEAARARELILLDPIRVALTGGDASALKALSELHPAGFWPVLEREIQDLTTSPGATGEVSLEDLTNAVMACVGADLQDSAQTEVAVIESYFCEAARLRKHWNPFGERRAQGLLAVMKINPDAAFCSGLVNAATSGPIQRDSKAPEDSSEISAWMRSILLLLRGMRDQSLQEAYQTGLTLPLKADETIAALSEAYRHDPHAEFWQFLKPACTLKSLNEHLTAVVPTSGLTEESYEALTVMSETGIKINWASVAEICRARLQLADGLKPGEAERILRFLRESKLMKPPAEQVVQSLLTTGWLFHRFHEALAGKNFGTARECLLPMMTSAATSATPPAVGNSHAGFQEVKAWLASPQSIPDLLNSWMSFVQEESFAPNLWELSESNSQLEPLVVACGKRALGSDLESGFFTAATLVSRWQLMRQILDTTNGDLKTAQEYLARTSFRSSLISTVTTSTFDPTRCELYHALLLGESPSVSPLRDWIIEGLRSLPEPAWATAFGDTPTAVDLVYHLSGTGITLGLGLPLQDALYKHAVALIGGGDPPSDSPKDWACLILALSTNDRVVLRKRLYELLCETKTPADAFLDFYGEELIDISVLHDTHGDTFQKIFGPILESKSPRGLQWITAAIRAFPELLTAYPRQEFVSVFHQRVLAAISQCEPGSVRESLQFISENTGVTPAEEEPTVTPSNVA